MDAHCVARPERGRHGSVPWPWHECSGSASASLRLHTLSISAAALPWQVVDVTAGTADDTKAAKARQLRLEGRGLLQGLEAVERELA